MKVFSFDARRDGFVENAVGDRAGARRGAGLLGGSFLPRLSIQVEGVVRVWLETLCKN